MSGRKQHHIPQLLLRGFATKQSGRIEKLFVFRKGIAPIIASVSDTAAARDFYSDPSLDDSRTLDDQITEYENRLADLVQYLREAPLGDAVEGHIAAEVVTHLTQRNSHVRSVFRHGFESTLSGVKDVFLDQDNLRSSLGLDGHQPTDLFLDQVRRLMDNEPALQNPTVPIEVLEEIAFTLTKENFDRLFEKHAPQFSSLLSRLKSSTKSVVRAKHNELLSNDLVLPARKEFLAGFHWIVVSGPSGGAILPDCVAIGVKSEDSSSQPFLMTSNEGLRSVLMPLSSSRILLGTRLQGDVPSLKRFNYDAAECSHDFFVASSMHANSKELLTLIGQRSAQHIDSAISDSLSKYQKKGGVENSDSYEGKDEIGLSEASTKIEIHDLPSFGPASYQVRFACDIEQLKAERIAEIIKYIVFQIGRITPLQRLDGITFASDYEDALRDLDRGSVADKPLETVEKKIGVGVAQAPLILRDGVVKSHVIMRSHLAFDLDDDQSEFSETALHILVHELARVSLVELIDDAVPGNLLTRIGDSYDVWEYGCAGPAIEAYFSSKFSSGFGADSSFESVYREQLMSALDQIQECVPNLRFEYRYHGDMERLLEPTSQLVGRFLQCAGNLIGHCAGTEQETLVLDDKLETALQNANLRFWFDSFHNDLETWWHKKPNWTSFEEFSVFGSHVKRILWQFGLFPWRTKEGVARIEVPLASDAMSLLEATKQGRPIPEAKQD